MKTPVAILLVERYKKRHLAAQVRSANGLRGIFKFSEILGSTTYTNPHFMKTYTYTTHTLQNPHITETTYTHTHTPHITKPVKTTTVQDTHQIK